MTFTSDFEAIVWGKKGGQSRSEKKQAASRRNGRKGGRRVTRSLLESLLKQRLTDAQEEQIKKAVQVHMHIGDIQRLAQHFDAYDLDTENYRPRRGVPKNLRMIVEMLKVVAKHSIRPSRPVSPYVVEYQAPSPEQQDAWALRYAHCDPVPPCPQRRVTVDVRRLGNFIYFKQLYARNPKLTVAEIMEGGGSLWTHKRAERALEYIKFLTIQDANVNRALEKSS